MVMESLLTQHDIDPDLDLEAEIVRLKRDKNAVILAHYYQESEIQDIADFVGDSLDLSRKAAATGRGYDCVLWGEVHGGGGQDCEPCKESSASGYEGRVFAGGIRARRRILSDFVTNIRIMWRLRILIALQRSRRSRILL